MRKEILCALMVSCFWAVALAQTPAVPEPRTVAECLQAVQQYPAKQAAAARKAGQKLDYRAYMAQAKELAAKYAGRFKIATVRPSDLPNLARLYLEADQPEQARAAIGRRLRNLKLTEAERADALVTAVEIVMKGTPSAESVKLGEEYTAHLDARSHAVLKQKIAAHSRMAGYYGYMDIDDKNLEHNQVLLKLLAQLPPADAKSAEGTKASAYDRIALVRANRGEIAQALATLEEGKAALDNAPQYQSWLTAAAARYALIGQPGAPLKGDYWINAAPATKQLDLRGRVTLIQFTAHWCGPCRKSYPAMLKFHEQFKEQGLDVVLATQLYGYFDKRSDLNPEGELAANREYYVEHHQLPLKIAVEARLDFSDRATAEAARREMNEGRYQVGGIPQIVLLDKHGVIRQILIGWDPANEARIATLIEQLLKEPVPATSLH
jgi:thiol-disulfide isomerase/thioredoxin